MDRSQADRSLDMTESYLRNAASTACNACNQVLEADFDYWDIWPNPFQYMSCRDSNTSRKRGYLVEKNDRRSFNISTRHVY